MSKASRSGITVSPKDLPLVFGMIKRGDRNHDIAAWFGYNQGRVAEVKDGNHGHALPASESELPPSGSPGPRARDLRAALERVISLFDADDYESAKKALTKAVKEFDKNE
jgi:hypothetical protein